MQQVKISVEGVVTSREEAQKLLDLLFSWTGSISPAGPNARIGQATGPLSDQVNEASTSVISRDFEANVANLSRTSENDVGRRLYKVPDVAKILGVSRSTVYELLRQEKLKSIRIGKSFRVTAEDLDRFVDELR